MNQLPNFTSASTVSVLENVSSAYQAVASDPEGQSLTFSLAGGADGGLFDINASGQISFKRSPSFETPQDANGDNIYDVNISVSDGSNSRTQALAITVTNSREGVSVSRSTVLFDQPVAASPIPGSNEILIAERGGSIWRYNPVTEARTQLNNLRTADAPGLALVAITARPDFPVTGQMVVAVNINNAILLYDVQPGSTLSTALGLAPPMFSVSYADPIHATVALSYDNNDSLFAAFGDAGGVNDPAGSAQGNNAFGKLLRFRPNPDPFAGASPAPFSLSQVGRGLQNPRGMSFYNGSLLLGDRGTSRAGEINLYSITAGSINFGWPFLEGANAIASTIPAGLTAPSLQLPIGTGRNEGAAIVGGAVFPLAGTTLGGLYVFGDSQGNVFTVPVESLFTTSSTVPANAFERRNEDFAVSDGGIGPIAAIIAAADSGLMIIAENGRVYRVTATSS